MQLTAASSAQDADMHFMVRGVKVVKIFYVSTGRNAWWSTWITRYSPGCMHSTFESAKSYCQLKRVQGTIFYIDELPSLAFVAPKQSLVVSEINCDDFLSRLNAKRLTEITTVLPVSTMTLRQMTYVFRPQSPLWPAGYPQENSAILSFCADPATLSAVFPSDELSSFASISHGPKYLLDWSERPFTKKRSVLHGIASALNTRMG